MMFPVPASPLVRIMAAPSRILLRASPRFRATTDKGDPKIVLVDVVFIVGGGEDFGLVDVVDSDGFEDLGFHEVANPGLGHDWDSDGLLDFLDELWVRHAGHASLGPYVGGDSFQGHDRAGAAGFFGYA
ncbi:unnamed protein product, partial [Ilex paraguariensis]